VGCPQLDIDFFSENNAMTREQRPTQMSVHSTSTVSGKHFNISTYVVFLIFPSYSGS